MKSDKEPVPGELTSRVNRRVRFGVPRDIERAGGAPEYGVIVDEIWADPEINRKPPRPSTGTRDWGDYSFCSQLIRWNNGEYSIRLAYYRRQAGGSIWRYASQTTVNVDWRSIKLLLNRTLTKTSWFRADPISAGNS